MADKNKHFEQFKPARNFMRQLNLFDSLYVLRQYIIAYDTKEERRCIRKVEDSDRCGVSPNIIDFCIVNSLVYSPTYRCSRSISTVNDRCKLLSTIIKIEETINEQGLNDDVWCWLKTFGLNQNKLFTGNLYSNIYRYYKIFNEDEAIRKVIDAKIGIRYKDFIACAIWIYCRFGFDDGFCVLKSDLLNMDKKLLLSNKTF